MPVEMFVSEALEYGKIASCLLGIELIRLGGNYIHPFN
jgi:hypothetical protein